MKTPPSERRGLLEGAVGITPRNGHQEAIVRPIPNDPVKKHGSLNMILNDMYKRFGAVFVNLRTLAKTDAEREFLTQQLHGLRSAVRELIDQAQGFPK